MIHRLTHLPVIALLALGAVALPSPVLAQEAEDEGQEDGEPEGGGGEPSELSPAPGKDLLKLKSGEVISGKIVQLSGTELTFESDTLGEVKLPWDQVESIEAGNSHDFATPTGTMNGVATGAPGRITLQLTSGEVVTIGEGELDAINPDPPKTEIDYWSGKIFLGASLSYGNSRQRTGTAIASVTRDDGTIRWSLEGISTYGQSGGRETVKAHRAFTQLDYNVTDRFYAIVFVGSLDYDRFQNIDRRFRGGPGLGYWILKDEELVTWNVETGYAYTHTVFRRVTAGTKRTRSEHAVRAATRLGVKVNEHIALRGFYESYIGTGDIQDTTHHVEAGVSFKYSVFSLDLGVIYDRQERTTRRSDGELPKRNDAKVVAGLGVAF